MEVLMHWFLLTYVFIFAAMLLFNAYYWLANKGKIKVLLYELFSGAYLILMILLFIYPELLKQVSIWPILLSPAVLASECYFSIWGKLDDLVPNNPQISANEIEAARGFSVIFSSPAYIISAKMFIDKFF